MGKYYARENRGYFDYDGYYGEEDAKQENFWAGGNRDFCEINKRLGTDFLNDLEKFYDDCNTTDEEFADEKPECDEFKKEIVRLADSWLASYNTRDNHFTYEQAKAIYEAAVDYNSCSGYEVLESHAKALSVVTGINFKCGQLVGSSQSDWINYIAPETMEQDHLDYIEAVYFGTGTEFDLTEEPIESADDFEDDDVIKVGYYTAKWRDDDIKADLARQAGYGCKPEDIVLLKISAEHHITTYDYEEV